MTGSRLRVKVKNFVESSPVQNFIMAAIIINAITLGLETVDFLKEDYGFILLVVDHFVLGLFVAEMLFKLTAYRFNFFKSGWNIFDFTIVAISLFSASSPLSVLRAFRIIRALRLLSIIPQMRNVLAALFSAMPGIGAILAVLTLVFYIFAVIATKVFGDNFHILFGSIGESMFTLFQIMTLDDWANEVVRPIMHQYPYAWLFFMPFIVVASFTILNLFIAIIVSSMTHLTEEEVEEQTEELEAEIHSQTAEIAEEIASLRKELKEIKSLIKSQSQYKADTISDSSSISSIE